MAQKVILHICPLDKFIPPFIDFIRKNFPNEGHVFLTFGNKKKFPYEEGEDTIHLGGFVKQCISLFKQFYAADQVILHGLFSTYIIGFLFLQPWLLRKCHWVIWGGDLYAYRSRLKPLKWRIKELMRRPVIKNMGGFVGVPGDYDLVCKWYNAKGVFNHSFVYTSNLHHNLGLSEKVSDTIYIQIGNSADPANLHEEVLALLEPYKDENIHIICPLSYGEDVRYAKGVAKMGEDMFGKKFQSLFEFLPFEDYLKQQSKIDIAVFAHKRQQAMGNIITLLGSGKKVYMQKGAPHTEFFDKIDVKIYSLDEFTLTSLDQNIQRHNIDIIQSFFSEDNLKAQLQGIWI